MDHSPAGKIAAPLQTSADELVIAWDCGQSKLWTIFYKNYRFLIGTSPDPIVTEYLDGKKLTYKAASVCDAQNGDRGRFVWMQVEGKCILRSDRITEADRVRIYQDEVWKDELGRYYVKQDGESFQINRRYVTSEGELTPPMEVFWHRDFADRWNRDDPRPEGLTRVVSVNASLYYLPWNFNLEALDALNSLPKDDRELLLPSLAWGQSALLGCRNSSIEPPADLGEEGFAETASSTSSVPGGSLTDPEQIPPVVDREPEQIPPVVDREPEQILPVVDKEPEQIPLPGYDSPEDPQRLQSESTSEISIVSDVFYSDPPPQRAAATVDRPVSSDPPPQRAAATVDRPVSLIRLHKERQRR